MSVTITKVTGIGGNPPTLIRVDGVATGCEKVTVTITCNAETMRPVDVIGGAWSITYENRDSCFCGDLVTVTASCAQGAPGGDTKTLPLVCDPPPPPPCCDDVTIDIDTKPLPCLPATGGTVSVHFSATLSPAGCVGPFEWRVSDVTITPPTVIQQFTSGSPMFSYLFTKAGTYEVKVRVQQASTCDDTILTDKVTFQIASCCCPDVTLSQPTVTGCAPGSAVASFVAALNWPMDCTPATPTSFDWTIDGPGGKKYKKSTAAPSTDTTSGWNTGGNPAAVQFIASGNYSVSVSAKFSAGSLPLSCDPTDTLPFTVAACDCPPGQHRDASGNCVPTPPPSCPSLTGLTAIPSSGTVPLLVNFQASVTNPGSIVPDAQGNLYHWDFGDGKTAHTNTPNTPHPYLIAGTFPATVTVNVPSGCSATTKGVGVTATTSSQPPPTCSIACNLAGFFLIAVPISAGVSSLAHCYFLAASLWQFTIGIAIGVFIATCGICCLWRWLLVGAALGVVATAIAAYWLGFPSCWLQGAAYAGAFVGIALGMGAACKWR